MEFVKKRHFIASFDAVIVTKNKNFSPRIIRTCRKMGISTVAVHSVADANSLFVKMADEAVNLGPPEASKSYLVMEKILKVRSMVMY